MTAGERRSRWAGWAATLGLLVAAPVGAEYLSAYDDSTGAPVALLGALALFVPLYGAPAVLIRELGRRWGWRWPQLLTAATGFGLLQAGVIDQSLFNDSYRDIGYWDALVGPTYVAPLGLGVAPLLVFVVGHAVWSFAAPIAVVEAIGPRGRWLGVPALVLMVVLYAGAAILIGGATFDSESDLASTGETVGLSTVVAVLFAVAWGTGRRPSAVRDSVVPSPAVCGVAGFAAASGFQLVPTDWWGVAVASVLLVVFAAAAVWFSRSPGWTLRHTTAVAGAALVARSVVGFLAEPLGDVSAAAQLAHNVVFLVAVVSLWWWAAALGLSLSRPWGGGRCRVPTRRAAVPGPS